MSYLVIAYPELSAGDLEGIQSYRKKNDERYFSVVEPHITFVFPTDVLNREAFVAEIKKQVVDVRAFDIVFRVAVVNKDSFGGYFHEFLVPEEGFSHCVLLRDRLYSDLLKSELRLDIDFIPHIGIGNADQVEVCKQRIDELNLAGIDIKAKVNSLDVIEYNDGVVTTIERIKLA